MTEYRWKLLFAALLGALVGAIVPTHGQGTSYTPTPCPMTLSVMQQCPEPTTTALELAAAGQWCQSDAKYFRTLVSQWSSKNSPYTNNIEVMECTMANGVIDVHLVMWRRAYLCHSKFKFFSKSKPPKKKGPRQIFYRRRFPEAPQDTTDWDKFAEHMGRVWSWDPGMDIWWEDDGETDWSQDWVTDWKPIEPYTVQRLWPEDWIPEPGVCDDNTRVLVVYKFKVFQKDCPADLVPQDVEIKQWEPKGSKVLVGWSTETVNWPRAGFPNITQNHNEDKNDPSDMWNHAQAMGVADWRNYVLTNPDIRKTMQVDPLYTGG